MIGDDIVVTYGKDGEVKNAYGSAEKLSVSKNGKLCQKENINHSEAEAIQKAKDKDANDNGKGRFFRTSFLVIILSVILNIYFNPLTLCDYFLQ